MKILATAVMLLIMFVIYRLLFSEKTDSGTKESKTIPPEAMNGYEAVIKKRYVLPDRSKPAQHEDRKEESDKTVENANIFAGGNEISNRSIIQSGEMNEVFGTQVKPEDLDIEKDESEMDSNDELNTDEEAEELRQIMGGKIEGYSDGITYDEMTTVFYTVNNNPEQMTDAEVETLRSLSETDVFEQIVSSYPDKGTLISSLLDSDEQSLLGENDVTDDNDTEYQNYDMTQFFG